MIWILNPIIPRYLLAQGSKILTVYVYHHLATGWDRLNIPKHIGVISSILTPLHTSADCLGKQKEVLQNAVFVFLVVIFIFTWWCVVYVDCLWSSRSGINLKLLSQKPFIKLCLALIFSVATMYTWEFFWCGKNLNYELFSNEMKFYEY